MGHGPANKAGVCSPHSGMSAKPFNSHQLSNVALEDLLGFMISEDDDVVWRSGAMWQE